MACEFKTTRRVEFADTDAAGIMHFSRFFTFMEAAEHEFYRSLGFSVDWEKHESLGVGWPRVKAECEYLKPLRFEDEVEIELRVAEVRNRSLALEFTFRHNGTEAARGRLTVVCVAKDPQTRQLKAVSIPAAIRERLEKS